MATVSSTTSVPAAKPATPARAFGGFHAFVHAGPMFPAPIAITPGEVVERGGFVFADVLPDPATAAWEDRSIHAGSR
jgi:hypothetical protein